MLRWRLVTHVDPCRVDLVATVLGGVSGEPGWVTSACRIEHLVPRRRRTEVDGSAFDRLARATATGTGRRSMLKSAAALLLAAAGIAPLLDTEDAAAARCVRRCHGRSRNHRWSGNRTRRCVTNCRRPGSFFPPTSTVPPPPTRLVMEACTPGVEQCVSGDARQPVLTCGLKNTEQQCNSTVAEIPGPTACCVPLGQPCVNNSCQCCADPANPNLEVQCKNPGPVGVCGYKQEG